MRRGSLWSAALCVLLGACGSLHSAQEIRGRTIDAATGDPVAGVIVVAQWEPFQRGIGHAPGHREVLHVYETLTGADGRYVIPAWGPKPLPFGATMEEVDPALLFFKPGYVPVSAMNSIAGPLSSDAASLCHSTRHIRAAIAHRRSRRSNRSR